MTVALLSDGHVDFPHRVYTVLNSILSPQDKQVPFLPEQYKGKCTGQDVHLSVSKNLIKFINS